MGQGLAARTGGLVLIRKQCPKLIDGAVIECRKDRVQDMREQRTVALYGNSLLIDIVEASLANNLDLVVIRVDGPSDRAVEQLKSLSPDMIVVDSAAPDSQFVLSFFKDRAGVPLLCLDPNRNKAMILSCQHYSSLTTTDLTDLVQLHTSRQDGHNHSSGEMLLS